MGMIGNLLRVTKAELESYLEDSSLLEDKIYNDEVNDDEPESEKFVDIDKTWDGIIFLLTGQSLDTTESHLARILFSG